MEASVILPIILVVAFLAAMYLDVRLTINKVDGIVRKL